MFADRKKGGLARAVASCPTIHTLTGNTVCVLSTGNADCGELNERNSHNIPRLKMSLLTLCIFRDHRRLCPVPYRPNHGGIELSAPSTISAGRQAQKFESRRPPPTPPHPSFLFPLSHTCVPYLLVSLCRSAGTEAGIAELRDLLTQPSAGGSPPCTFLGVSPPLRSGAANPLGHSSTFTRVAPVACTKNLQFLQQLQCTDGLGPFADRGVFRLSSPKDAMFARPFPQMSDGASGSFEEGRRPQAALPASFPCVSTSGRCSPSQHVSERLSPPGTEVHA
jgi:hypothetical protein